MDTLDSITTAAGRIIKAGDKVRFNVPSIGERIDTVRQVFMQEERLEPYARNTLRPAVVLTEHSWVFVDDILPEPEPVLIHSVAELAVAFGDEPGETEEETVRRVARTVYKSTACGASFSVGSGPGPRRRVRYVVRMDDSICGPRATGWRLWGQRAAFRGFAAAPAGLLEYLDPYAKSRGRGLVRLPDDLGRTMNEVRGATQETTGDEFRWIDRLSLGQHVASIVVDEPGDPVRGVVLSSMVEGSEAEVPPVFLAFPFTLEDWDRAVQGVEDCAAELWEQANEIEKAAE